MTRFVVFALFSLCFAGCSNPMNLSYDFGRAYLTTAHLQADLSRPSAAAAQYRLSGMEGTMVRFMVNRQSEIQKEARPVMNIMN